VGGSIAVSHAAAPWQASGPDRADAGKLVPFADRSTSIPPGSTCSTPRAHALPCLPIPSAARGVCPARSRDPDARVAQLAASPRPKRTVKQRCAWHSRISTLLPRACATAAARTALSLGVVRAARLRNCSRALSSKAPNVPVLDRSSSTARMRHRTTLNSLLRDLLSIYL
jgi:hypothetical protein